jgi:hypothetical protein
MKTTKPLVGILIVTLGLSVLLTGCGDKDKVTGRGTDSGPNRSAARAESEAKTDAINQLNRIYSSYDVVSEHPKNDCETIRGNGERIQAWVCTYTIYVKNAKRRKE